jgi:hypothetical protein
MSQIDVLMPCGGQYKRFPPGGLPKYLRPLNDMRPIFIHALQAILPIARNIYFSVRKQVEEHWGVSAIIKRYVPQAQIMVLKTETRGPAHTIYEMIKHFNLKEPFLSHDNDCSWNPVNLNWDKTQNAIVVAWRETAVGDRGSKSWVVLKKNSDEIGWIEEKKTPTDWYCHGSYQFADPQLFCTVYDELLDQGHEEIFCSRLIQELLKRDKKFYCIQCTQPDDWGTWEKYVEWRSRYKLYLFDLDGVITEAGTPYGKMTWDEVLPLNGVKEKLTKLIDAGNTIVILTARPSTTAKITEEMLEAYKIPYHRIVYDLPVSSRVLINDYAASNPYPSAISINTPRNSASWIDMI